ncbi:MAG: sulfotransferase [Phycisphaerae bacterium]|nr:MAG: sulfotransferase [Phycisphaerae bacterium]
MTRVAYILAPSHSGSTLLAMLLGAHPDACTVGELKVTRLGNVDKYRCACGASITQCEFWKGIAKRMRASGVEFDVTNAQTALMAHGSAYTNRLLRPLHRNRLMEFARDTALGLSPTWHKQRRTFAERNVALMQSVAAESGAQIVVDSSKTAIRLKYLLRQPQLDVCVIRLIRDGRGGALALMEPAAFADATDPKLRGGGSGGNRDDERLSMEEAANEWKRSNEEADQIVKTIDPTRVTTIHYEDVCETPLGTLGNVFQFLGLDPAKGTVAFRDTPQHVIGNGMRLDSTSEIRLDERWREQLSDDDLSTFERVAGDANRRYGYQ